jgi:GcpE protein
MRSVKTDFVSCPSCGRTLFDLQEVTEQIKQKTGHLPGVAIAIMVRTFTQSVTELIYSSFQPPLHLTATFHRVQSHFMRPAPQQQLAVSVTCSQSCTLLFPSLLRGTGGGLFLRALGPLTHNKRQRNTTQRFYL